MHSSTDGIATYKKKIVVCELGKAEWRAAPPSVIRRSPLRFETVTLHVDRTALDARLFEHACALGTEFIWERVTDIHTDGDRITGCSTAGGQRVDARWYIDASGTARVLSRAMNIPTVVYGQQKVCLWTYFDTPPLTDGTAFFVDNGDRYLSWVWDIPISPRQTSVGFVLPSDVVRSRRQSGSSVEAILRDELSQTSAIPRSARFTADARGREHVVSTLCDDEGVRRQLVHGGRGGVDAGSADGERRDVRDPSCASRVGGDRGRRCRRSNLSATAFVGMGSTSFASVIPSMRTSKALSIAIRSAGGLACRQRPTSTRSSRSS